MTGSVLWWPGIKNWRRAFKVNPASSWRRINFDLHSAAGFWTLFFTIAWATSGIYFAWERPFEKLIGAISPIVNAQYPEDELRRLAMRPAVFADAPLDLTRVLAAAKKRSPGARLEGLYFGTEHNPILTVYLARGDVGDYARTDFLYFDQQSGTLLYTWHRGVNQTLGDWLLWLMVPLHFGTSFGLVGKVLWCIAGLVLPLLVVTGFVMYWNRFLRKQSMIRTVLKRRRRGTSFFSHKSEI